MFCTNSTCSYILRIRPASFKFHLRDSHSLRLIFPYHSVTLRKCLTPSTTPKVLLLLVQPPALSLATTRAISFDFSSSSYLDVSVRRVPSPYLCIQYAVTMLHIVGLPHSDICGSKLICSSPQLFAACRVLLRLPMPRHSPCALYSLNFVRNANLSLKNGFCAFLNCSITYPT